MTKNSVLGVFWAEISFKEVKITLKHQFRAVTRFQNFDKKNFFTTYAENVKYDRNRPPNAFLEKIEKNFFFENFFNFSKKKCKKVHFWLKCHIFEKIGNKIKKI